jgi:hypothetical protein
MLEAFCSRVDYFGEIILGDRQDRKRAVLRAFRVHSDCEGTSARDYELVDATDPVTEPDHFEQTFVAQRRDPHQ